jgi:hypothetical protein
VRDRDNNGSLPGSRSPPLAVVARPTREFAADLGMAFGQQAGPPATGKQLKDLLALLQDAGHEGFRDARGPMGFSQRQAGGKFTRDEADAFIQQLEESGDVGTDHPSPDAHADPTAVQPRPKARASDKPTAEQRAVRRMSAGVLAAELQRRGWVVMEP